MKSSKNLKGLTRIIGTKLAVILIFCIGYNSPVYGQNSQKRMKVAFQEKLKVAFQKLERMDEKEFHSHLDLDIGNILKAGFLHLDYIEIVDLESRDDRYQYRNSNQNKEGLANADLIIQGSYAIYEKTFLIDVQIFRTSTQNIINVNPVIGDLDNFYTVINNLDQSIIRTIGEEWLSDIPGKKKIAIICKTSETNTNSNNANYYKELTVQITKSINEQAYLSVSRWDKAAEYYLSDESNHDISHHLDVDALLIANIKTENEIVIINPEFYIKENPETIELGEVREDYFKDIPFDARLVFRTNNFLSTIQNNTGAWDLEYYLETADDSNTYFNIALKYYDENLPSISNFYYFKSMASDPSAALHYNLAINYTSLKRPEEAKQEYRKSINIDPNHVDVYYNLYMLYISEYNYDQALIMAKEGEKIDPQDSLVYIMLGESFYFNDQFNEAIASLQKGTVLYPDNALLHGYLGLSYLAISSDKEALESFMKAYKLERAYPYDYYIASGMVTIGNELMYSGEYEQALEYFLESENYYLLDYVYENIVRCYLMSNQLQKAIVLFDEGLSEGYYSKKNGYYKFLLDLRDAFIADGPTYHSAEYGEAIILNANIHLVEYPDDIQVLWLLGNVYSHLGRLEESTNYLMRAYKLDNLNTDATLDLMETLILIKRYEDSEMIYKDMQDNQKIDIMYNDGEQLLIDLLQIANITAISGEFSSTQADSIYKKIKKGVKITGWSYRGFRIWIEENLSGDNKTEMEKLVNAMEEVTS